MLYAGARNGSIKLFDLRVSSSKTRPRNLLGSRHHALRSIISTLDIIGDWQLLVAGTNNQVGILDSMLDLDNDSGGWKLAGFI